MNIVRRKQINNVIRLSIPAILTQIATIAYIVLIFIAVFYIGLVLYNVKHPKNKEITVENKNEETNTNKEITSEEQNVE